MQDTLSHVASRRVMREVAEVACFLEVDEFRSFIAKLASEVAALTVAGEKTMIWNQVLDGMAKDSRGPEMYGLQRIGLLDGTKYKRD